MLSVQNAREILYAFELHLTWEQNKGEIGTKALSENWGNNDQKVN